jgi:hypothetical protein
VAPCRRELCVRPSLFPESDRCCSDVAIELPSQTRQMSKDKRGRARGAINSRPAVLPEWTVAIPTAAVGSNSEAEIP